MLPRKISQNQTTSCHAQQHCTRELEEPASFGTQALMTTKHRHTTVSPASNNRQVHHSAIN